VIADPVALTRALVDIESVSGNEKEITDAVQAVLRTAPHLDVERAGNVLRAGTGLGRAERVILAGHLDTVPLHDNFPSTMDGEVMYGCGTADMKSGAALALHLAVTVPEPAFDVTYLFYDNEEVTAELNGLTHVARDRPEWLVADLAVLLEPTYGVVEAGWARARGQSESPALRRVVPSRTPRPSLAGRSALANRGGCSRSRTGPARRSRSPGRGSRSSSGSRASSCPATSG